MRCGDVEDTVAVAAGDQLRRAVPEADEALVVEQEDPVADSLEHARGVLALGGGRLGAGAGCRLALRALVQQRVAHGGGHQADQALGELEVLRPVLEALVHQLHDADDLALVLDRQHHRRLDAGRPLLGHLAHLAFLVDVVVDAGRLLDLLRDVVDHERLAADDHAALHPAAFAVEVERRQERRVELLAVDERVVAVDPACGRVEGGDDHAAVRDGVGEQLVEAVVDALELESLVQVARGGEQQLGLLCPRVTAHVVRIMP